MQKVQWEDLKGAFAICEVPNHLINLNNNNNNNKNNNNNNNNNNDISGKDQRPELSNFINICIENWTFLTMENMEWNKIRRQCLSKVLPPKLLPLTKNVPTPSEFLLGNNLSDRIDNIEMSQKVLQT